MANHLAACDVDTSKIAALIPIYDNGNVVMAITKDGQTLTVDSSIKPLIKYLLKRNGVDFGLLRKSLSGYIAKDMYMPVPLSISTVLLPVKVRKKLAVNDGALGYVDLYSIISISDGKSSVIALKCGQEVRAMESGRTIKSRAKMGFFIQDWFSSRLLDGSALKECISGIGCEYEKAATKGDITLLAYEIMKLRSMLNK